MPSDMLKVPAVPGAPAPGAPAPGAPAENFIENWPWTGDSTFSDVSSMFASMFASDVSVSEFVSQVVDTIVAGGENPARLDTGKLEKHIDALTMGAVKPPVWQ